MKPSPFCMEMTIMSENSKIENIRPEKQEPVRVFLNADEIASKEKMAVYMKTLFDFPDYFGGNLDALNDMLSEISRDTEICLTRDNLTKICDNSYAYRTLIVLSAGAEQNPHLKIRILP